MRLAYLLVNVFTQNGGRLTGNPLCVFEDGSGLDTAQMQALALQFNLSETTFIANSEKADARVRIFTPSYEMPFAGHPTLGTAHVVRSLKNAGDSVALELNVGVIPVKANGNHWELRANAATTRKPKAENSEIAAALGLKESDLSGQALWVNSGSEQLIVPLASEDAVRRVKISFEALSRVTQDGPRAQAYVFAATGKDTLLSRFFFSKGESLLEDPATGSATANLGGWYLANNASLPLTKTISQGEMAGRPSALRLRIDAERNVFVAGEVIELGRGFVEL
jgi:trans-2,3-dihydro-3-hydroxyanthranilate isomerase